jgi:hypothetical protein
MTQTNTTGPDSKRSMVKVRWLAVALISAITVGLLNDHYVDHRFGSALKTIPSVGFGYESQDVPLTSGEKTRLSNVDVVKRLYRVGDQELLFTAIDASRDRHAIHDPLYCFYGGGWAVLRDGRLEVANGQSRYVLMGKKGESAEMVYWFTDGQKRHASIIRYWLQTTARRLSFGTFGSEPIMVTLQPVGNQRINWPRIMRQLPFMTEL